MIFEEDAFPWNSIVHYCEQNLAGAYPAEEEDWREFVAAAIFSGAVSNR